jgi:hypothetical protein
LPSSTLKSYTYAELSTATGNFRPDNVLGEGSFGAVLRVGLMGIHWLLPNLALAFLLLSKVLIKKASKVTGSGWLVSYTCLNHLLLIIKKQIVS